MGLLKRKSAQGHGDPPKGAQCALVVCSCNRGAPSFLRRALGILKCPDIRWNLIPQVQGEAHPVSRSPLVGNPEGTHSTESCWTLLGVSFPGDRRSEELRVESLGVS